MTITTKIAKNGAINFYNAETGKRVKEADVVMDAIENGSTYYTAYVHGYNVDHVCTKEFASPITAYKWICRMARKNTTYADGDAQIIVGFNGEEIYTQKMSTAAIKNDELRAYVEAEEAPYVAESLRQERENQIVLQMSHRNITREQAEELVDYLSANRKNYSNEVAATVKAMLANFKKINNPEPAIVDATIETKIAKNETLICKLNGKRVAWHNALAELEINPVGTVVAGNGHSYTCITNNVPAPEGLTYETGYLFEDENGNRYIFDNSAFAIRAIAYNNVDEYAVTQDATVEAEIAIVETVNAEEQSTNTESANENSENNAELVNQRKTFNAKVRGLSCEEFLAENAGLPIAEYREQKAAAENRIAKLEIEFKIEDIKSEIGRLESENYYTARNLYGIVVLEKHYATDESLQAYAAELVDEFNDRLGKINEAQAELATLAPATAEKATAEVKAELPSGNITVNSGAGAWAIVGKHFPEGVKFNCASKGFNREDTFSYTNDEVIYVEATCTPDNSRVECIEVINTNESGSARRVLTVNIADGNANDTNEPEMVALPAPVAETVEEPAPAKVDIETLNRQAQLYAVSGKAFSAISEALTPPVDCDDDTADQYESAYQTLKAAREHFSASRREFDKNNRDRIGQLKQLRKDAVNDRLHKVSTQVKAMFDAAIKTVDVKKVSAVVYYTCADDKSNWVKDKYFETTSAAAEWILSFVKTRVFGCTVRDAEIIDRRNGYVRYVLTDADITAVNAVNTEPELPTPKPDSPFAIARGLDDVFRKTFHRVDAPYLDVTTQDGAKIATTFGATFISVDWRATDGYVFGNHFNDVLARYETPEQVIDVMTALRDAVKAGKTEFAFPTVEALTAKLAALDAAIEANQPAKVKALNAELDASTLQAPCMWIRIVDGAGNHRSSFSGGSLSAVHIEYNAEPEAIKGYTLRYFDEPMELYDTFAQVTAAVEQFKAAIISNADAFTFPTVEALTPEEPAPVVEETDYEKFLKASEYVITSPGRYLGTDKFGEDRFAVTWKTRCPLRKINKATARNILATFGLTPETYLAEKAKWVAAEIARGSRQFAINLQAEFLRDKIDADRKASVEPMPALYPSDDSDDDDELIDPPVEPVISKEQLIDSLERAMKTALEKFQQFCLVKNLTAAENELKLYNICRLATRELWKE